MVGNRTRSGGCEREVGGGGGGGGGRDPSGDSEASNVHGRAVYPTLVLHVPCAGLA